MIDTIRLSIEDISESDTQILQSQMTAKWGVEAATGEISYIVYQVKAAMPDTGAILDLAIKRQKWVKPEGEPQPIRVSTPPVLSVEVSLHKAMLGHNVVGGPLSLMPGVRWLRERINEMFGVDIPRAENWLLRRVDVAETFDLGSEAAVKQWLDVRKNAYYPRRELISWRNFGFVAYGRDMDLRAYAKGEEFIKNGIKRLYSVLDIPDVESLRDESMRYLRVEVSLKRGSVDADYKPAFVPAIPDAWLGEMFDKHWSRFMREQGHDEGTVRRAVDVQARLFDTFDRDKAVKLLGTWFIIAANGEAWYRRNTSRATAYRHCSELRHAGIALEGTDVRPGGECIPLDFIPSLSSPRRVTAQSPVVAEIEARYA